MSSALDLGLYTDRQAMRALLQEQLPGYADGALRIEALEVRSARRNTSRERNPCALVLCYELQLDDRARGRRGRQLLMAHVYRDGRSAQAHARHGGDVLVAPAFGEPLVHVPQLDMLVWALPNDPELPQLALLLDPVRAARRLPPEWREGQTVQVELLRYTPQQRATLRYTALAAAAPGQAAPRVLYAKTFNDDRARDIHARFAYFWSQAQADADAPLVAQPLACDAGTRTALQAPAVGVPLLDVLRRMPPGDPAAARLMQGVARALARLHRAPLVPAATATLHSAAYGVAEARRRQTKIGRIHASLAARAKRVADAIEARAARQAERALGLIHGDFHPDQIWIHEGRVVLFDFDEFTYGDPMEDLATFVLKLQQAGVARELGQLLVDHYAACAPARFDPASLDWHLALQGLKQVSRAFIFQQPGWAGELERRLADCERRAAALAGECVA